MSNASSSIDMLPSMRTIRPAVCFCCTLGIALCPNFSPGWHIMKKHWRNHFSEMEDKNACRTPQAWKKKRKEELNWYAGSSMTSGNTELHLGWAILETLFLNLNYTKQWQDLGVMMLGKQRHSAHSLGRAVFPSRTGIYYPHCANCFELWDRIGHLFQTVHSSW